jgi:GTPase SAR1 family protein
VYDITNRESFESIDKWMSDARALRDEDQAMIVMAGNKADLGDHARAVTKEEAEEFAREKNIMSCEISALNG